MSSPLIYLVVGVVLGGLLGWFAGWMFAWRRAAGGADLSRVEAELRSQLQTLKLEHAQEQKLRGDAQAAAAGAQASRENAEQDLLEARQRLADLDEEMKSMREEMSRLGQLAAVAEAQRDSNQRQLVEQEQRHSLELRAWRDQQAQTLQDLRQTFKALSTDALREVQPEFLRLANETLGKYAESAKGDLAQRQQAIATLVKPLEEKLQAYQSRLQQSESSQSNLLGEVRQQLEALSQQSQSLSSETHQLRRLLSSNQARGRWGEETLRRVVESAGMSTHCDFTEQAQADDSKPDLIIRLPGDRLIIVDAKVPDLDFVRGLDGADEAQRATVLEDHAAKLKNTIKGLADRDYPSRFPNALDYVILFLPAESLFSAALEGDRDLMIWAQNRRILLATPTSLLAILRSVSLSWQHHAQTQNAREIAAAAQELYGRVCKFTEHFERIRDGLEKASNAYNQAVGSYERQVRPSAERLKTLGAGVEGREMADVAVIEPTLRLPPANVAASQIANAPSATAGKSADVPKVHVE